MQYTNQQLKEMLAKDGKILTSNQRETIADAQATAAQIIEKQYERTKPLPAEKKLNVLERALINVPALVNFIADVGNTLTTLTQAMIPASLPFLLIFLIFAEAERVRYGVSLFEVHQYLAYIVAYILVIGNAFLELAIQHRHAQSGYEKDTGYVFSLRLWLRNASYALGVSNNWQPRRKSPAVRLERLQAYLTAAILFLAIGGSMKDTISQQSGNWRQGLVSIFVDSSLLEILTWLSGLVSAVVIVLLAQIIVAYAYGRASEYYHELLDRKAMAAGESSHELEQWQHERNSAMQLAREQAERELLIQLASKRQLLESEVPEVENLKAMNGTH